MGDSTQDLLGASESNSAQAQSNSFEVLCQQFLCAQRRRGQSCAGVGQEGSHEPLRRLSFPTQTLGVNTWAAASATRSINTVLLGGPTVFLGTMPDKFYCPLFRWGDGCDGKGKGGKVKGHNEALRVTGGKPAFRGAS